MKISERTLRISASSFLALLMMSASFLLSGPNSLLNKTVNAGSTEELLKAYAAKDTDVDGLPDWQETLYGTDPKNPKSNSFGITDGEAASQGKLTPNSLAAQLPGEQTGTTTVQDLLDDIPGIDPAPGSITEQFSHEFFQEYIETSGGQPLSDEDREQLVSKLLGSFTQKAAGSFSSRYTAVSLRTDPSMTVLQYAGQVEQLLRDNDVPPGYGEPIPLMEALIQKNDESARPKLKVLAASYRSIDQALLAMKVPPQMREQHLALVRGFDELNKATVSITTYESDPLAVMGALSIFQPSSDKIITAFKGIATVILGGGEPAPGTPGAMLVNVARSVETP